MKNLSFQVSVPTDSDGFIGRACDSKDCGQYFKVFVQDHRDHLYCPYCATRFSKNELLTGDQHDYVIEAAKEEAVAYAAKELQKMLKDVFGGSSSRRSGITYKPRNITRRHVHPRYAEREVDTELQCPECNTRFQVYGIFGFCPGCRAENLSIYEANWAIIEKEVNAADNPARALRHAYGDLVSTFENFCKRKAAKLTKESCNFHALFEARKFFKTHAGVDIFDGLGISALLALRRVFNKRHAYVHSHGRITDRYVKMVPEDSGLLGQQATLDFAELKEAATAMSTALATLVKSTEKRG